MNNNTAVHPSPLGRGAGGEGRSVKLALPADLTAFARELRETQTDAEALMWYLLRDRRFFGLKFRRQHPFPPYVLDFYCKEINLAIELDGGHHNEVSTRQKDQRRQFSLAEKGVRVVRYWNDDLLLRTEEVLEDLMREMSDWGVSLTPSPSPEGRGEEQA